MALAAMPSLAGRFSENGYAMINDKQQAKSLLLSTPTQYRLKKMWEQTTDPTVNHKSWAYKSLVIATAKEVFQVYPSLLSALHTRMLTQQPSHYEFLQDCRRFLDTGVRAMSVNHWNTVLTYETWPESDIETDTARQREARLRDIARRLKINHETHGLLIAQWCKQPQGYVDLAYTLKILYLADAR